MHPPSRIRPVRPGSGRGGNRPVDVVGKAELIGTNRSTVHLKSKRAAQSPPLYRMVVQTLQDEIVRGVYPVGTPLPSEAMLVKRFGISRHTVRQALRDLRDKGLVQSHQGLGTLVQQPGWGRGYVHRVNAISDLFPRGVETRYQPLDTPLVALPQWAVEFAGVPAGQPWLLVPGLRTRPGAELPFNEVDTYVSTRFARIGRLIDSHAGAIHSLIETLYGESIDAVEQEIGGFVADGVAGRQIGMQPGDVGIEIRRIYRITPDSGIAMISSNRYTPGDFTFSMTLRRVRD